MMSAGDYPPYYPLMPWPCCPPTHYYHPPCPQYPLMPPMNYVPDTVFQPLTTPVFTDGVQFVAIEQYNTLKEKLVAIKKEALAADRNVHRDWLLEILEDVEVPSAA